MSRTSRANSLLWLGMMARLPFKVSHRLIPRGSAYALRTLFRFGVFLEALSDLIEQELYLVPLLDRLL
jgi:hypothetical protein